MKILILRGKDKSKTAVPDTSKTPLTEVKGVPVRITTYDGATRTHGAEAVVILKGARIRSIVATAGEIKLYLSPRAQYRVIEPEPPEQRPADGSKVMCAACMEGKHADCDNIFAASAADMLCDCTHGADRYAAGGAK